MRRVVIALLVIFGAAALGQALDTEDTPGFGLQRDKRQGVSERYLFTLRDNQYVVVRESDDKVLIVLTGSVEVNVSASEQVLYGSDTVTIPSRGESFANIETFYQRLPGAVVQEYNGTTTTGYDPDGPGFLYVNAPDAFFSKDDGFTNNLMTLRAITPPITYTASTVSVREGGRDVTVLEVNDMRILTLTGSESRTVSSQEAVSYSQMNTVTILRGANQVDSFPNIVQLSVLEGPTSFETFPNTAGADFFNGRGMLYVDTTNGIAFFTTSTSDINTINNGIVNDAFQVSQTSPGVLSLQDSSGNNLLTLTGAQPRDFMAADSFEYQSNTLTLRDSGDRILGTFNNIMQFSVFDNNDIQSFSGGTLQTGLSGGGALFTDADGNAFFSTSPTATAFVLNNIPPPTVVPTPVEFSVEVNNQGIASLTADNMMLVTLTGAQIADVPRFGSLQYANGMLTIADAMNDPLARFGGIDQLSVNVESGSLQSFSGSAGQTFIGPGRVYINDRQAFYTTDTSLTSRITSSLESIPAPAIDFGFDVENGVGSVNLTVGGMPFVTLTESTVTESQPGDLILYNNDTISTIRGFQRSPVPSGLLTYSGGVIDFMPADPNVADPASKTLNRFLYYDGVTTQTFDESGPNVTLPGGGTFYVNPDMGVGFYTLTDTINDEVANALIGLGVVDTQNQIGGVSELGVYDGNTYVTYRGSAPRFIAGSGPSGEGGTFYTSGGNSFFSTDPATNRRITTTVSNAVPVISTVDENGFIVVTYNNRTIYRFNPGQTTSTVITFGPQDTFTYVNGTIVSSRFPDPIPADMLTLFNGITTQTFGGNTTMNFSGPGTLIVDSTTGEAFYTTSSQAGRSITFTRNAVLGTYRRPVIDTPAEVRVLSKFPMFSAQFGQDVTVYEGADVSLLCNVIVGNPEPVVTFSRSDGNLTEVPGEVEFDGNTLILRNVQDDDTGRYTCVASNAAGSDLQQTNLTVGSAIAPRLVTNFLPFIPNSNQTVARVQPLDDLAEVNVDIQDRPELYISCKATGRPKPEIMWGVQTDFDSFTVNLSDPNYFVNVTRPGRSLLFVNQTLDTTTTTYLCFASNFAGTITGSVRVVTEQFFCTRGNFSECSSTICGPGIEQEILEPCFREVNNINVTVPLEEVPNTDGRFDCAFRVCAATNETTGQIIDCPPVTYEFRPGPYGNCSRTCGGGVQMREVVCNELVGREVNRTVHDTVCLRAGRRLPRRVISCNTDPCPVWKIGRFGQCSVTCGEGGVRMRSVQCISTVWGPTKGNVLDDSECRSETRPSDTIPCITTPCLFRWQVGRWEQCSSDFCSTRDVFCYNADQENRAIVNDSFCEETDILSRPFRVRNCNGRDCEIGSWFAGPYSECSRTCGLNGTQTREVFCVDRSTFDRIDEDFCNILSITRPNDVQQCFVDNCPGECDQEPPICPMAFLAGLCRDDDDDDFFESVCCLSCPQPTTTTLPLVPMTPTPTPTTVP